MQIGPEKNKSHGLYVVIEITDLSINCDDNEITNTFIPINPLLNKCNNIEVIGIYATKQRALASAKLNNRRIVKGPIKCHGFKYTSLIFPDFLPDIPITLPPKPTRIDPNYSPYLPKMPSIPELPHHNLPPRPNITPRGPLYPNKTKPQFLGEQQEQDYTNINNNDPILKIIKDLDDKLNIK